MATRGGTGKRRTGAKKAAGGTIRSVIRNFSPVVAGAVMLPLLQVVRGDLKE